MKELLRVNSTLRKRTKGNLTFTYVSLLMFLTYFLSYLSFLIVKIFVLFVSVWAATPRGAQGLLFAFQSEISPSSVQGTKWNAKKLKLVKPWCKIELTVLFLCPPPNNWSFLHLK